MIDPHEKATLEEKSKLESALKRDPSIEDLKVMVNGMLEIIHARFGERASAILMIGVPVAGGHDRFAANAIGPCLAARGLLDWGGKEAARIIAAFRNPADQPGPQVQASDGGVVILSGAVIGKPSGGTP